jgi:hypothetical protein
MKTNAHGALKRECERECECEYHRCDAHANAHFKYRVYRSDDRPRWWRRLTTPWTTTWLCLPCLNELLIIVKNTMSKNDV